jgi:amino acid transporter
MTRNKQQKKAMRKQMQTERDLEIKRILKEYKLPWITRAFKKAWFCFLRYTFLPIALVLIVLFIIYNSIPGYTEFGETIWIICKTIILFYIFGIGGFAILSHVCEIVSTDRLCKKMGLTHDELQYYVTIYQIKGY